MLHYTFVFFLDHKLIQELTFVFIFFFSNKFLVEFRSESFCNGLYAPNPFGKTAHQRIHYYYYQWVHIWVDRNEVVLPARRKMLYWLFKFMFH